MRLPPLYFLLSQHYQWWWGQSWQRHRFKRPLTVSTALFCGINYKSYIHWSLLNPILSLTERRLRHMQTHTESEENTLSDGRALSLANSNFLKTVATSSVTSFLPNTAQLAVEQSVKWAHTHIMFGQWDGRTPGCWWNHWWIPLRTGSRCPQCVGSWTSYPTCLTHTGNNTWSGGKESKWVKRQ